MNFTCPYCNQPTTINTPDTYRGWSEIIVKQSTLGETIGYGAEFITCPNLSCSKATVDFFITSASRDYNGRWQEGETILKTRVLPNSEARPLPEYIPKAIVEDYTEACKIVSLSPKASATLSRRCLQGMIRDFYNIKEKTLFDEIDKLQDMIDSIVWESIDCVRQIGNIGAHMQKDINEIIEVDKDEAELLIELIEQLIEDWYIARHKRAERAKSLKDAVQSKSMEVRPHKDNSK